MPANRRKLLGIGFGSVAGGVAGAFIGKNAKAEAAPTLKDSFTREEMEARITQVRDEMREEMRLAAGGLRQHVTGWGMLATLGMAHLSASFVQVSDFQRRYPSLFEPLPKASPESDGVFFKAEIEI